MSGFRLRRAGNSSAPGLIAWTRGSGPARPLDAIGMRSSEVSPMPFLLLTESDVRQILTMDMAIEAVIQGLRKLALDEAQNIPRARTQTDHAMQHVMSAA